MGSARLFQAYQVPASQRPSRAALVPGIREAVHAWRRQGYPGVTETSKRLLQFWFESDHLTRDREEFLYYYCQREAVETLIYLYEVVQKRSLYALAQEYDKEGRIHVNAATDRWARYVFKMATGSGKTKVMSLAIVWSYFNARFEAARRDEFSQSFALIAPNVIVYQRLLEDFRDGKVFRDDPLIPPEWEADWQFTVITRDDPGESSTPGTLYLTNIHQLYDARTAPRNPEPAAMTGVLGGPRPTADSSVTPLRQRMLAHRDLIVLNDEAHHVRPEDELKWWDVIVQMDAELRAATGQGLRAQLDFTATPKHTNGALFNEIVVDYPIAAAIEDGIVKRPEIGELSGARENIGSSASEIHRDKLNAGVRKWREFRDKYAETGKKPLLFVMTEDTKSADDVGHWLETQPDFGPGTVLVIHTNREGEIVEGASTARQKELEMLREASRRVDAPDTPYRAIVSVLMLREGWDVKNVCVIVPLRAYSAAAQILPEQTLGRGLRRMWPVAHGDVREKVIVIEHEAFRGFWEKELGEEGFKIPIVPVGDSHPEVKTVHVVLTKLDYDIDIPVLTPSLTIETPDLTQIDIARLPVHRLEPAALGEDTIKYTGRDILSGEVVDHDEFERDFPAHPVGYLNVMVRLILRECRLANLANGFAQTAPLMKRYIEQVMFGGEHTMDEPRVMARLNHGDAKVALFDAFVDAIRALSVTEQTVKPEGTVIRLSDTNPYPTTKGTIEATKTVFNLVPHDRDLERDFALWLDKVAKDVLAFAKNEQAVHFEVAYLSHLGGLRYYRPDFIIRTPQAMYVVETKGLEDLEVAHKDARIRQWCRDATALGGSEWRYLKVSGDLFDSQPWPTLAELERAASI